MKMNQQRLFDPFVFVGPAVAQRRFIVDFDDFQILQPLEQEIFVLGQLLKDGVAAAVVQQTDADIFFCPGESAVGVDLLYPLLQLLFQSHQPVVSRPKSVIISDFLSPTAWVKLIAVLGLIPLCQSLFG